jgi:hypothetical protein
LTFTPRRVPHADVILSMAGFWTLSTQIVRFEAFALECAAEVAPAPTSASAAAAMTASSAA